MRLITIVSALLASALVAHAAPAQPLEERKHSHKHARHHASRVTYYGGGQLKNPACGGPNPHPNDMIAAVKKGGHFKCHDHIHIRKGSKKVTVRVVDYCAGCMYSAAVL